MSAYNIKQITNYDIEGNATNNYSISIPSRQFNTDTNEYEIVNKTVTKKYITAFDGISAIKLGYNCETSGIIYPIYLKVNGSYKPFRVGRNGMYEVQPEQWENVNDEESAEKTTNIIVSGARVPADIDFTLDYVIKV